ncbi:LOW QUALITY PROTEIN: DNA replication factor Cdt1 [Procambarus clarkii]|uniref:LOW QUALITY PROTEIN: DNA replication factor Cdt1 n=1 Tax=Procambarus clarkii TaxID=6728 RepID=UPI0037449A42
MAATQTNLRQFFKNRKSARDTNFAKNGKNALSGIVTKRVQAKIAEKDGTADIGEFVFVSSKSTGLNVGQRLQTKAEETLTTTNCHLKREENLRPPVTPKRKRDEDEETKRKKRKQIDEDNGYKTPEGSKTKIGGQPETAQRSAKKKLIMGKYVFQQKLTPEEIKERLGKCGRLDELHAKLLKVNQCHEKLRQFKQSTVTDLRSVEPPSPSKGAVNVQLKRFTTLDVDVPLSPQKTPVKTPYKTPIKAPAYERFQHLVETPSEELLLPYKYRFVKEVFRAVDTVVSLLHNRQEVITYSKLKPAVQEMLRRTFEEHYLGQIKTVFPLAYLFKQEKNMNVRNTGSGKETKDHYQLTVACNLDYKPYSTQNLSRKFEEVAHPQTLKYRKMDSIVMVERRNIFHNSLVDILRDHHDHFLQSLEPPIMSCGMSIKRWHPDFLLEDVPEIEPSPLPQPPAVETFDTARDILDKAQDLFSVNQRMEQAMKEAAAKTPVKVEPEQPSTPLAQPAYFSAALKGVSSSLLEKIRAREAAKSARGMTRSSTENKELEMLSRLPEISRIIRNAFITDKKAALPWEVVAGKVAASYSSILGASEVDSHLHLLIKEVPGWCTIHKVRSGIFLKINKTEQLSNVIDKLESVLKQRR